MIRKVVTNVNEYKSFIGDLKTKVSLKAGYIEVFSGIMLFPGKIEKQAAPKIKILFAW